MGTSTVASFERRKGYVSMEPRKAGCTFRSSDMIKEQPDSSINCEAFVRQLEAGSAYLNMYRGDITGLWNSGKEIEIVSFYETKTTSSVSKVRTHIEI